MPVSITNNSPSNITLEHGDQQEFTIDPETQTSSGIYQIDQTITASQTGGFAITANIYCAEHLVNTAFK